MLISVKEMRHARNPALATQHRRGNTRNAVHALTVVLASGLLGAAPASASEMGCMIAKRIGRADLVERHCDSSEHSAAAFRKPAATGREQAHNAHGPDNVATAATMSRSGVSRDVALCTCQEGH